VHWPLFLPQSPLNNEVENPGCEKAWNSSPNLHVAAELKQHDSNSPTADGNPLKSTPIPVSTLDKQLIGFEDSVTSKKVVSQHNAEQGTKNIADEFQKMGIRSRIIAEDEGENRTASAAQHDAFLFSQPRINI